MWQDNKKSRIININEIPVRVEVADTEASRQMGLMNRASLDHDSGMLFIFDSMDQRGFWMKNTRFPLSIAFIDDNGQILNIEEMNPYDQSTVRSSNDAQCALEMNRGWFKRNSVGEGDMISGIFDDEKNESYSITLNYLKRIIKEEILK